MEIAHWTHSWTAIVEDNADRVYIGHDTSFDGFPSACDLIATAKRLDDRGKLFSLVAPPLMENEMIRLRDCLDTLSNRVNAFEVVCNDWGLLEWLTQSKAATPVLGRFLTGQATDPRLAALDWPGVQIPHERLVPHADGTHVNLRYRPPSAALVEHVQCCAIDTPPVLNMLWQMGVHRLELSNSLQGATLAENLGWRVSLHLPEVPIAVLPHSITDGQHLWRHPSFPVPLVIRHNCIFYVNDHPNPLNQLPGLDRIVLRPPLVTNGGAGK